MKKRISTTEQLKRSPEIAPIEMSNGELPPMIFPTYTEKYVGKEILAGVRLMASELEEYEVWANKKIVPAHELVEYLQLIDFFETYPKLVEELLEKTKQHRVTLLASLRRDGLTEEKARRRMDESTFEMVQIASKDRPLLTAVLADFSTRLIMAGVEEVIEEVNNRLKEGSRPSDRFPLYAERYAVANAMVMAEQRGRDEDTATQQTYIPGAYLFVHHLELAQTYAEPLEKEDIQDLKGELMEYQMAEGRYLCSSVPSIPGVQEMYVVSPSGNIAHWGSVQLLWKNTFMKEAERGATFSVSNLTGDLAPFGQALSSIKSTFNYYGGVEHADQFVAEIYRCILRDLREGVVKAARQKSAEAIDFALAQQFSIEKDDPDFVDHFQEGQKGIESEENTAEEAETFVVGKKVEVRDLRNVKHERALKAFQRMGVEVRSGGRHIKLVRVVDGRERTVPFINRHSKGIHYMARVIKQAVSILGLEEEVFIKNLY